MYDSAQNRVTEGTIMVTLSRFAVTSASAVVAANAMNAPNTRAVALREFDPPLIWGRNHESM